MKLIIGMIILKIKLDSLLLIYLTILKKNSLNQFKLFYTYVHKGYFSSINGEMLPRVYSYKPRKRTSEKPTIMFDNVIRTGRTLKNERIHEEAL